MERQGIVVRANSPWSSPLHMVKKSVGWRPCGDFSLINMMTVKDTYQLPNIQDFSANLHGKKIFTTLDLTKGYLQVPVAKESQAKTAIVTPFGTFIFLRMQERDFTHG